MRRLISLTFCMFAAVAAPAVAADPLTNILLFRYGGADSGAGASQFGVFREILNSKAQAIPGLFVELQNTAYLAKLTIVDPKRARPANLDESRNALKEENALQLFVGILEEEVDHSYWVTSNAFLGELGTKDNNVKTESLRLRLQISAKEFKSLNDTHTLVMLYALYLDARRSGGSKELQAALLEQSRRLLSQLERRGDLDEDVKLVDAAVKAARAALGSP